jgi:branched-chain amino acid aminotransferase
MIFYLNGKFVDEKEAKISVYDLGLLRGYAVFDFLRTYNQKPFYLDDHLKRLLNSAKIIGLKHNYTLKYLRRITLQTLRKNIINADHIYPNDNRIESTRITRPNKLPESSDRINYSNNIYPNKRPNKLLEYQPNKDQRFGPNSGNLFGQNSGSKNIFGSHSGNKFGIDSSSKYSFGQNSGKVFGHDSVSKNDRTFLPEYNIRIILTGGDSKDFITPSKPNLIVMVTPLKELDEKLYRKGGKLITKISERILPQAKTIIYTEAVKFMQEAKKKRAIEVLLLDRNKKILECTTSNFFAVIDRKLITPPLFISKSQNYQILPGITRKIVINLAKKLKIPVIERDIYFNEIRKFDEAFITASNKEILPIIQIDNFKISNGPGPITKILMAKFKELTKNFK